MGSIKVDSTGVELNGYKLPSGDGTSGQVLTTDGAGNLSWQTPTGGSGGGSGTPSRVLLQTVEITSQTSSVDLTNGIDATYDQYHIEIEHLRPVNDRQNLRIHLSNNNGVSWHTGNYSYSSRTIDSTDVFMYGANNDNRINCMTNSTSSPNVGNKAGQGLDATIKLVRPADASIYTVIRGEGAYTEGDWDASMFYFCGTHENLESINGVRLYWGASDIASGTVKLYGVN